MYFGNIHNYTPIPLHTKIQSYVPNNLPTFSHFPNPNFSRQKIDDKEAIITSLSQRHSFICISQQHLTIRDSYKHYNIKVQFDKLRVRMHMYVDRLSFGISVCSIMFRKYQYKFGGKN
jgi:hypothetical protein